MDFTGRHIGHYHQYREQAKSRALIMTTWLQSHPLFLTNLWFLTTSATAYLTWSTFATVLSDLYPPQSYDGNGIFVWITWFCNDYVTITSSDTPCSLPLQRKSNFSRYHLWSSATRPARPFRCFFSINCVRLLCCNSLSILFVSSRSLFVSFWSVT